MLSNQYNTILSKLTRMCNFIKPFNIIKEYKRELEALMNY